MTPEQLDGITKARLSASIERTKNGDAPHSDDAAYIAYVCESAGLAELPAYAADSYAQQYANRTITDLEQELADAIIAKQDSATPPTEPLPTATVNNVPVRVTKRQARTLLELTPEPTHGDMWQHALALVELIPDAQTRIVTRNYLIESQWYERDKVHQIAGMLLGMTPEQADQLMITAATL